MTHPAPQLVLVQSEPEAIDPLVGTTLDGRYLVEGTLGAGGMGLVYRARHVVLGKSLAIKVLKHEVSRDEQVMARFRREAQSASAIGSPHICDVSDFGSLTDGSTYFVMEFLDGPSLTKALEMQRPMAIERIVRIGVQLCDALGAAHERGIVHRDLKPDNVHLIRQGKREDFVKVLDFGIAKVGNAADKKLTQAGQVFGTPHYMSPEQCAGRDVDHRTDVYALGVMLYEMATGQVPFDADNLMGVLTKHVYEQPIPPRALPPPVNVPPGLEAVILKCLAKQSEQRYQTMGELRTDLELVAIGTTPQAVMHSMEASMIGSQSMSGSHSFGSAYPPGMSMNVAYPPSGVAEEPPKSKTGLIALAVVGLLVLGSAAFAVAFFLLTSGDERTEPVAQVDDPPVTPPETPPETPPVANPPPTSETPPPATAQAPAMVSLTTDPPGAEVYSGDGSLIGNTPLQLARPAQGETINVAIRMPGFQERTFTVSQVTSSEVTVRLERARVAQPVAVRRPPPVVYRPPTPQPLAPRPVSSQRGEIINPF